MCRALGWLHPSVAHWSKLNAWRHLTSRRVEPDSEVKDLAWLQWRHLDVVSRPHMLALPLEKRGGRGWLGGEGGSVGPGRSRLTGQRFFREKHDGRTNLRRHELRGLRPGHATRVAEPPRLVKVNVGRHLLTLADGHIADELWQWFGGRRKDGREGESGLCSVERYFTLHFLWVLCLLALLCSRAVLSFFRMGEWGLFFLGQRRREVQVPLPTSPTGFRLWSRGDEAKAVPCS